MGPIFSQHYISEETGAQKMNKSPEVIYLEGDEGRN